jgi:hypothetical protein
MNCRASQGWLGFQVASGAYRRVDHKKRTSFTDQAKSGRAFKYKHLCRGRTMTEYALIVEAVAIVVFLTYEVMSNDTCEHFYLVAG